MISDILTSPLGIGLIVILLVVAFFVAIGATPGTNQWRARWPRKKDPSPAPEAPQQLRPAPPVEPAPPKQEPPSTPTPEPPPSVKPEAPCAQEREEIRRLTEENAKLKKPKPPREVTEANVSDLLAEFGKINSKGEKDIRYEAEQSEPNIEKVGGFLKKFATHLVQTGYDAPTPEKLMKLLWKAAEGHRQRPR